MKSPLVKEENEMLRPMWCYVFFLEDHFLNEIPKSLFFSMKKIITFLTFVSLKAPLLLVMTHYFIFLGNSSILFGCDVR